MFDNYRPAKRNLHILLSKKVQIRLYRSVYIQFFIFCKKPKLLCISKLKIVILTCILALPTSFQSAQLNIYSHFIGKNAVSHPVENKNITK
jgi:hypothetical protein